MDRWIEILARSDLFGWVGLSELTHFLPIVRMKKIYMFKKSSWVDQKVETS